MAAQKKQDSRGNLKERNIAIFQRYIELENKRDYENLEQLFHPNQFVCHTWFGHHPIQPRALTRMLRGLFRAFPDWYMTINEIISADEEAVAGRITGRGTQHEEFMGRTPSDKQIAIPLIHTIRVDAEGYIVAYRATNPFDDPFQADVLAPEDVQEVRAQQGVDSRQHANVLQSVKSSAMSAEHQAELKVRHEAQGLTCQTLLKANMRRCQMPVVPGEIYCKHHLSHGYGVDGVIE